MTGEHGEPLRADNRSVRDSKDGLIANVYLRSDAKRIAACLNALDGVTTEAIEAGAVRELVKCLRWAAGDKAYVEKALKPFEGMANVE